MFIEGDWLRVRSKDPKQPVNFLFKDEDLNKLSLAVLTLLELARVHSLICTNTKREKLGNSTQVVVTLKPTTESSWVDFSRSIDSSTSILSHAAGKYGFPSGFTIREPEVLTKEEIAIPSAGLKYALGEKQKRAKWIYKLDESEEASVYKQEAPDTNFLVGTVQPTSTFKLLTAGWMNRVLPDVEHKNMYELSMPFLVGTSRPPQNIFASNQKVFKAELIGIRYVDSRSLTRALCLEFSSGDLKERQEFWGDHGIELNADEIKQFNTEETFFMPIAYMDLDTYKSIEDRIKKEIEGMSNRAYEFTNETLLG